MSFAPNLPSRNKISPFARTLGLWFIIIALVLLWQAIKNSKDADAGEQISYSNFLQQVESHNIATATLVLSQNTAEVHGNLRDPSREYRTTVPRANVSDLTEPLRTSGINFKVSQMPVWEGELLNFAPLLLGAVLWIVIIAIPRIRLFTKGG